MHPWVTSYSSQILLSVALENHLEITGNPEFPLFVIHLSVLQFTDFHTWNNNNQRHNSKVQLQLKINLAGDENRPGWRSQHSFQALGFDWSMEFSIIKNQVKSDNSKLSRRKFVLLFISFGWKGLGIILKDWFFSLHWCLKIRNLNVFFFFFYPKISQTRANSV